MNSTPLVSVVMPVYNGEFFLSKSIKSVLKQTYKSFEFIIIDDASIDSSWVIIKKFAAIDKRIKAYKNKKNMGQSRTISRSLKIIKGKYFFKLDQDDLATKQRLAKEVEFLEKNLDYLVVGSNINIINEQNKVIACRNYPLTDQKIRDTLPFKSPFAYPATAIRVSALRKISYPNMFSYADDYYMWFLLLQLGKGANLVERLLNYRVSRNQVKEKSLKIQLNETLKVQEIILKNNSQKSYFAFLYHYLLYLLTLLPSSIIIKLFNRIEYKRI